MEILASLPAKRKIAAVTSRTPSAKYIDPLDHIWITAAHELGLTVARSPHGYAHTDGKGNLFLAPQEDLDHDDCLAQMILHELCHALPRIQTVSCGCSSNQRNLPLSYKDIVTDHQG